MIALISQSVVNVGLWAQEAMEDVYRRNRELPLRWYNIEGSPQWVSGTAPERPKLKGRHEVYLNPGDYTCVRVPAYEWLRIVSSEGQIDPGDVEVSLSNGSGLLASIAPATEPDRESLFYDPQSPHPMLAYIYRPSKSQEGIRLGLFTSRQEPVKEVIKYRDLMKLSGERRVRLESSKDIDSLEFWKWSQGDGVQLQLHGPGRYKLESRYRYPDRESAISERFHITVRDIDSAGNLIANMEFLSSLENSRLVFEDGIAQLVGGLENGYFELPESRTYRVALKSSGPVYLRLLEMGKSDFLIPTLNSLAIPRDRLSDTPFQGSPWQLPASRIDQALTDPRTEAAPNIVGIAGRLARDNSISGGGMRASALLWNAGWHRKDYPELRNRWRDFSTFTFYRNAIPETPNNGFTIASFPNRTLRELGREQEWNILGEALINTSLKRLQDAVFSPVQPARSHVYFLPDRGTAGRLRVVARRDRDHTARFELRMEGKKSKQFRLLPANDSVPGQTRPSLGEMGLQFTGRATLDDLQDPIETVSAGVYEFMIPPDVRRVEISNTAGAEQLPVAVQYRTSEPFSLSESEYLYFVEGEADVFNSCLDCLASEFAVIPEGTRARKELYNHWEPLRRYIQSRLLQFTDSVGGRSMPDNSIEALDRLEAEGEIFLSERLARTIYLSSTDLSLKQRACEYLEELAIRKSDTDLMILNTCAKLIFTRQAESGVRLASLLREVGETKLALMLALAMDDKELTRETRLATSFQQEWWLNFEAALAEAPDASMCRVWRGIRLSQLGDFDLALYEWRSAGAAGKEWMNHAKQTANAKAKVVNGDPVGIHQWGEIEVNAPGRDVWKPVSLAHVAAHPQARSLKGIESGRYQQAFVATPNTPVEYIFPNPGLIRVECRPLHPAGSQSPLEGWVHINSTKFPVLSNFPTPGLKVVGHPNEVAGLKLYETVALSGWNNRVKIRPDFGPVLVRVSRREPEVRIGHLPELKEQTAAWLFNRANRRDHHPAYDYGSVALIRRDHNVTWHKLGSPFCSPSAHELSTVRDVFGNCPPISISNPNRERHRQIEEMRQWLTYAQSGNPRQVAEAIAGASVEWKRHRIFPELKSLHSAILRRTYWEPLLATEQNGGFREVETEGWDPETPGLRTRMLFLPKLGLREQLVTGNDSTVAMLTNSEPNRINVSLARDTIPFLPAKPIHARVEVGTNHHVDVRLDRDQSSETLSFDLPEGRTSVKVSIIKNEANQYLRVGFDSRNDRETLVRKTVRNWFVAYPDEPLSVKIAGPAWVRIDRLTKLGTESDYHHVVADVESLTLAPAEEEALYRVHVLRHDPNKLYLSPSYTERSVNSVAEPHTNQSFQEAPVAVAFHDGHSLVGQEDGTWTAGTSYQKRRIGDEVDDRRAETFGQADLTYRYYDEDRQTWFRTTVLGRARETGDSTLGLEHSAYYTPFASPFTYSFKGAVFEQGGDWALSGSGRVSVTGDLAPKWKHTSSASAFGRILSRDEAGDYVDRDIFSDYKSNHGIGLRFGETISYMPWQDTRLYAGVGLSTNENIVTPDYINYKIGIEQLIGQVRLDANITGYRFFDDTDRADAISRHRLNLEAVGEFWTPNQQRFEAGLRWSHYFEEDENSISVFGRWHFGEGRLYRDFRPGEESFSDIRERQIPRDKNNRIHEQEFEQGR